MRNGSFVENWRLAPADRSRNVYRLRSPSGNHVLAGLTSSDRIRAAEFRPDRCHADTRIKVSDPTHIVHQRAEETDTKNVLPLYRHIVYAMGARETTQRHHTHGPRNAVQPFAVADGWHATPVRVVNADRLNLV